MKKRFIAVIAAAALVFASSAGGLSVAVAKAIKLSEEEKALKAEQEKTYISELFHDQGSVYMEPMEPEKGETVTLRLRTNRFNVTRAQIQYTSDAGVTWESSDMEYDGKDPSGYYDMWKGTVKAQGDLMYYRFIASNADGFNTVYYDKKTTDISEGKYSNGWQIVPGHKTPDWAKGAMWYSMLPDAFYNGNTTNDKQTSGNNTYLSWNKLRKGLNDKYGGDLKGIEEKLDYIKSLGADAIYFNPIQKSYQNAGYGPVRYDEVESSFGNEQDLVSLSDAAHERGLKMMGDVVMTFALADSYYFNRSGNWPVTGAYQSKDSKWFDLFKFFRWPDSFMIGWGSPSVNLNTDTARNLYYAKTDSYLNHYASVFDGYRFDCGGWLWGTSETNDVKTLEFVKEIRGSLKNINKDFLMISESDWSNMNTNSWDAAWNIGYMPKLQDYAKGLINETLILEAMYTYEMTLPRNVALCIADADGNEYGKRWAVGNWVPTADGVASGTSHLDADSFKYSGVTIDNSSDMVGYSIRVTAVDEFGASAYISSEPFTESPEHLLADTKRVIYDNMFDVTPDRAVASANQSGVTFETDENGNLKTVVNATEEFRNAVFMTSKTKYDKLVTNTETNAPFNAWAYPGVNPQNLTDFNADDTFVYEADFSTSGTTQFFLHVRTPDLYFGDEEKNQDVVYEWKSDYTGVILNNNGVYIGMCNYNKFVSGSFKLDSEDTGTHHIKVISSPTLISIYIDGTAIGENIQFNPSAWSDTALAGKFKSDKMIPTMAVHVLKGGIVTLTNQELYHYDVAKETAAYTSVDYLTEANGFDGITDERVFPLSNASYVTEQFDSNGVLTVEAAMSEAGSSPWTNICYVTSAKNFAEKGASAFKDWGAPGYINAKYFTDLDIADSFVYEADFARLKGSGNIYFHVRTPDIDFSKIGEYAWKTDYTGIVVNGNGVYLTMLETQVASSSKFKLTDKNLHHIKIVSTPDDVTVIIDGILIYDKAPFNKAAAVAAKVKSSGADAAATFSDYFASEDMIPTMAQFVVNCDMRITNQELRKVTAGVTPYTSDSQNLINSEYGELNSAFSNISGSFTESGNNFYSDTRYTNLETGRWTQDRLFLFGKENVKKTLDYKSSYVFSAIGTALNSSLTDPETGNTYPSRLTLYLGTYQDKEAFAFIQNTGFNFYIGSERKIAIDLAAKIGYSVGDSVRITALLTPFGFTFYFDGKILCTYEYADSNLINYQGLSLGIGGTLGCWRDIVIYDNTENGALYAQKLAKKAEKVNRVKGLYITDEDYARADAVAAAANAFTGTDNSPLTIYVGIPESIISGAKAVNNMVYEGLTRVPDDADYNFSGMYEHYGIALFDSGKCPITLNDKWQVDLDLDIYSIGASNVRFMFGMYAQNNNVSTLKGGFMIQDSTGYIVENPTGNSLSYTSLGGGGISIKKDDTHLHITYVVTPTENGVSLNVIGTSTDGNTNYFNFTAEYTDVTEINPYFFYRTANIGIKNLCVSYDLTDDFANLEKACEDKDTSDIAPLCVKNYSASLAVGKNILANTAQFGRTEIRNSTEKINTAIAAFEKFGDTNRDTKTNIADLVHLKKILCGLSEETVPSDMDADGDILSNDLVLLKQYFLK